MPLTGHMWPFILDPFKLLEKSREKCGDIFKLNLGPLEYLVLTGIGPIHHVLVKNSENYSRSLTRSSLAMLDISGKSILTCDGDDWKKRRSYLSPFFKAEKLTQYLPIIKESCYQKVSEWESSPNDLIDIEAEMSSLTMMVTSRIFFGENIEQHVNDLKLSLEDVLTHHWSRLKIPGDLAHKLPNPGKSRFNKGMSLINSITDNIIKNGNRNGPHLLAKMLETNPDFLNIKDEIKTILLAGHETTACGLSWAIAMLSKNKYWSQKVSEEANSIHKPITNAVLKETLRLYPPIWLLERKVTKNDIIGNHKVNKDQTILIAPWVLHRRKDVWDQPDVFNPQRFLDFKKEPNEFIPFGMGRHTCIGSSLAMIEAENILSTLLKHFEFLPENKELAPKPGLTLKIKGGLKLRFKKQS